MNSYDLLSLTTMGQSVDHTAGTTRDLPPSQSERDLMLDRQSSSSCEHRSCCKPNRRFLLWWVGNRLRELVTGAGAHRPEGANRGSPTGSTSPADHLPLTSSLLLPNSI